MNYENIVIMMSELAQSQETLHSGGVYSTELKKYINYNEKSASFAK